MDDLFAFADKRPRKERPKPAKGRGASGAKAGRGGKSEEYSAKDIEVLEGLEPVRRRPGMYIGGTDEPALHHLAAEVLDNAMDEAVAGQASRIEIHLQADGTLEVSDNGRGIPVEKHPKYKNRSALELIMTTLHSGGKFGGKVYTTSSGLHGVGVSVVNALSDRLTVEVVREKQLWTQSYVRGEAKAPVKKVGPAGNRRGTTVAFHPDPKIFGPELTFRPATLYRMARSKGYLFRGVEIRWSCDPALLDRKDKIPAKETFHFPGGISDYLASALAARKTLTPQPFQGDSKLNGDAASGKVEWAIAWPKDEDPFFNSYCNTVPTPQGGTHEAGLRSAVMRGLKAYGELVSNRQAAKIMAEDALGGACVMLSLFIENPQFQGQTKERLASEAAARLVESAVRDHFDHWLSGDPERAKTLLEHVIERADERLRRRQDKELKRASATRKLRLPGKLSDCTRNSSKGTEIFLVEGDSAGGSAKQARAREFQAVLPLRGKILNVASASPEKLRANQELQDLVEALGCGMGERFDEHALRYEKVVVMTDADVDGAHIASLLMTFFYKEMRGLIESGHLYLAMPPLYRISQGPKTLFARDDKHKDELMKSEFKGRGQVEISRFKGLGEMPAAQLKETAMAPQKRTLLRVVIPREGDGKQAKEAKKTAKLVESLMGRKPELRLAFIQEHARFARDLDV
ncbi:MAG: DNA topoisomerase IV subunit B [Rhodospirillales bacterium]|nr:DNA topoisomerase IV subunit B [Rhodospirillales bacterium]